MKCLPSVDSKRNARAAFSAESSATCEGRTCANDATMGEPLALSAPWRAASSLSK